MPDQIYDAPAPDEREADRRAEEWKHRDPFGQIEPTLLSGEHIAAYVRQTAMLHPIDLSREGALKGASCEILPGEHYYRWEGGKKIVTKLADAGEIVLPANSIVFTQIAARIRLPDYIAIRFNLRIKHVHRGLLLGTGPLVDPAFKGDLLIPLHNLTDSEYRIPADVGLIWIEFTKTSRRTEGSFALAPLSDSGEIFKPSGKDFPSVEFYFEKANQNRPIESSIPGEVRSAKSQASKALRAAKVARRTNQVYAGIGFLAILGAAVGLVSFLQGANQRVDTLTGRLDAAVQAAAAANAAVAILRADLERAATEARREREAAAVRERAAEQAVAALRASVEGLDAKAATPPSGDGRPRR